MVLVGGEITTSAWVDIEEITRNTVREIGYVHSDMGFDANSCAVLSAIGKQSPDINGALTVPIRWNKARATRPDVRLCNQRNRRADASACYLRTPSGAASG